MKETRSKFVYLRSHSSYVVAAGLLCVLACAACLFAAARAEQGPAIAPESAPPMKYIPVEERDRLAQERDLKKRARLGIELAEARLQRAEQYVAASRFVAATAELGIYQAIIEDAMRFLQANAERKNGKVSDKVRDLYKRLELTLRAHAPRLETIRRTVPSEEAVHVRAIFEYTRSARSEALNSFYGESVLREGSSLKSSDDTRPKESKTPEEQER